MPVPEHERRAEPKPVFTPGCETDPKGPHPEHFELAGKRSTISRYLELDKKSQPTDAAEDIGRALDVELDQFDKMEASWLSSIGKQGYCQRSKQLAKLAVGGAREKRVAGQVKRFCS